MDLNNKKITINNVDNNNNNNDDINKNSLYRTDSFDFSLCHDYYDCYCGYWH
jgi:hypothetical protein